MGKNVHTELLSPDCLGAPMLAMSLTSCFTEVTQRRNFLSHPSAWGILADTQYALTIYKMLRA